MAKATEHMDAAAKENVMPQTENAQADSATPNAVTGGETQDSSTHENISEQATTQAPTEAATEAGTKAIEQTATQATEQVAGQANIPMGEAATQAAGQVAEQVANQAATAPLPMESAFTWGGYFQAIGTLLILLALLWGVVWIVRRYGRFNFLPKPGAFPRDGLRLESQLPLGPRKGLMVVRFLNKRLLLGVTDHQITLLKETADDENSNNMEFKDVMEMAQRQKSDD